VWKTIEVFTLSELFFNHWSLAFLVEVGMLQLVLEQTAWNDRLDPEYPLCAYIRYQTQPKKKRKFES